jgi:sialate O-acetylesterase
MIRGMRKIILISVAVCIMVSAARADVRLPAIISDNMVLQANTSNPVWGWAEPNEALTITIADQTYKTVADANGAWRVRLDPIRDTNSIYEMTVAGKNKLTIHNILAGQVWLGSGQSNMELRVVQCNNAVAEINNANWPRIRLFIVQKSIAFKPRSDCMGCWVECSPKSIPEFSAMLYYFGRKIHAELKEPVGLIHSSWGGSPVESWTSDGALKKEPAAEPIFAYWKNTISLYPQAIAKYKMDAVKWQRTYDKAKREHQPLPKPLRMPQGPDCPYQASVLYNAMIAPVAPYSVKGILWYQGESNAGRAWQYRKLFPLLINDWREAWHQQDLSFYFVQLANFGGSVEPPTSWAELRQVQLDTLKSVPNTGMTVAIDIGDANDIHPRNKQEVGRRLALIALARDYGQKIEFSGPILKSTLINEDKVIIEFEHAAGLKTKDATVVHGFEIAGSGRKYHAANARIVSDSNSGASHIEAWSPEVPSPVAVRYAWQDNPESANLCNCADLPASGFKTDDWPWVTADNK